MKKIISLVVVATMLFTLFAVNVSAAVPTSYKDGVISEDFSGSVADGWTTVVGYNEANGTAAVSDEALTLTLTQKGDNSFLGPAIVVFSGETYYTCPPNANTVVEFDVTAVDNKSALLVVMRGASTKLYDLVLGAAGFEKGHTYHYVITGMAQDGMASGTGITVSRRDITTGGGLQTCVRKGYNSAAGIAVENGGYNSIMPDTGYAINEGRGALLSFGIGGYELFSTDGESDPTGACYTIDNVNVYENKSYNVDGVLFADDFEGGKKYEGEGTLATDAEGNTYGVMATMEYDKAAAITLPASGKFVLEFDLYSQTEGADFSLQLRCGSDRAIKGYTLEDIPTDGWYTYRLADNWGVPNAPSGLYLARAKKGTNEWAVYGSQTNPLSAKAETISGTSATLAFWPGANTFWIDNIVISESEATSFMAAKDEEGVLNALFSFSDIVTLYNTPATMAAVLATFNDGVLVDVDYATPTNMGGTINAELSADATDADEAYIYVWDGIGTAKPIMAEKLNLSSYVK